MCTGEEKHFHADLTNHRDVWHSHTHSVMAAHFNRLHHHPPLEHKKFTDEQLEHDVEFVEIPF